MATLQIPVGSADHIQGNADAPVTLVEYGDMSALFAAPLIPSSKPCRNISAGSFAWCFAISL